MINRNKSSRTSNGNPGVSANLLARVQFTQWWPGTRRYSRCFVCGLFIFSFHSPAGRNHCDLILQMRKLKHGASHVALVVKNPPARLRFNPWFGKIPWRKKKKNGNPLQYFCLENPLDRGAWWSIVYRVTQSQTRLKQLSRHACRQKHKTAQKYAKYRCLQPLV